MLMRNRLGGLPKKTQTFLFFSINSQGVKDFQNRLKIFAPLITTVTDVFNDREKIKESQDDANKKNITAPDLPITGINISFTKKGLDLVRDFVLV